LPWRARQAIIGLLSPSRRCRSGGVALTHAIAATGVPGAVIRYLERACSVLLVSRPCDLVIAPEQVRTWTPARQPVWRPALHSRHYIIKRSRHQPSAYRLPTR
jgi:hypothetical protein